MPSACLYSVLDVAKDADEAAIKKAYRLQALAWHPDKNSHRIEEAQERFKEIQNAYEILSDPHERAWYDNHREQILRSGDRHQARGGGGNAGSSPPDDEEELFPYFSSKCYSGYGDDRQSFYGVYSFLFEKLAKQEAEAHATGSSDSQVEKESSPPITPSFGLSSADSAQVNAFYAFWSGFSTMKMFAWVDEYNLSTAPNRNIRRRMEEVNKKSRKVHRREFNERVRELVAFVRKRDKRVAKIQAEEAARRAAKQAEEEDRRLKMKEERIKAAAQFKEADWITASEHVDLAEEEDLGLEDKEEDFYCVACDKIFRSEKQLQNHERSKKHMEQVALLRKIMKEEEGEADEYGGIDSFAPHTEDTRARSDDVRNRKSSSAFVPENDCDVRKTARSKKQKKKAKAAARQQTTKDYTAREEGSSSGESCARDETGIVGDIRIEETRTASQVEKEQEEKEEDKEENEEDEDELMMRLARMRA